VCVCVCVCGKTEYKNRCEQRKQLGNMPKEDNVILVIVRLNIAVMGKCCILYDLEK